MSVRRQRNRYKTEPCGKDFDDVLKRGKAFHKDGTFMVWGGEDHHVWEACRLPVWGRIPESARIFRKEGRYWREVTKEDRA